MTKLKTTYPLHETVTGYDFTVDKPLTPRQAMRKKCLECCGGSSYEAGKCQAIDCTLWPYRFGRGVNTDPDGDRAKTRMVMRGFALNGRNDGGTT